MPQITPLTKDQLFEKKIAENTGSNYNVGDISDVVPVTKDQSLLKEIALNSAGQSEDITELEEKVSATQDMISDAYDPTATYDVGDYCIYNDTLYRCNTAIATPEAFTPAKWDATTVGDEIIKIETEILAGSLSIIRIGKYRTICGSLKASNYPLSLSVKDRPASDIYASAEFNDNFGKNVTLGTIGIKSTGDIILTLAVNYNTNEAMSTFSSGWAQFCVSWVVA